MSGTRTRADYTVVACSALSCRAGSDEVADMLRRCVRSSRHGVLVVSGCTVGTVGCRLRAPGPVIVVQPCTEDREPLGAAVWIGPIGTAHDLAAVEDWIRAAGFDPADLPAHLTALHRAAPVGTRN